MEKKQSLRITIAVINSALAKAKAALDNPSPKLNEAMLLEAADVIETGVRYDQKNWAAPSEDTPCGTTCCIAGEFLLQSGFTVPELLALAEQVPAALMNYLYESRIGYGWARWVDLVPMVATALMGLEREQTEELFNSYPENYWHGKYAIMFESNPNLAAAQYLRAIASGKVKL